MPHSPPSLWQRESFCTLHARSPKSGRKEARPGRGKRGPNFSPLPPLLPFGGREGDMSDTARIMALRERDRKGTYRYDVHREWGQFVDRHTWLSKRNGAKLRESFCPAAASHSRPCQAGAYCLAKQSVFLHKSVNFFSEREVGGQNIRQFWMTADAGLWLL